MIRGNPTPVLTRCWTSLNLARNAVSSCSAIGNAEMSSADDMVRREIGLYSW